MMKVKCFMVCFFLILPQFIFAQLYKNMTLGYNTREIVDKKTGKSEYEYFFVDNAKYSNVRIEERYEIEMPGIGFRYEFPDYENPSQNGVIIVSLYQVGNANSYDTGVGRSGLLDLAYTGEMITIDYENGMIKLYNSPEAEIEDKYLKYFVKNMLRIIDILHKTSKEYESFNDNFQPEYCDFLHYAFPYLKKQEYAIIRNLLFARYNYAFQSAFWKDFMNKYYPVRYDGRHSQADVMKKFNWWEKWLLETAIEYENE